VLIRVGLANAGGNLSRDCVDILRKNERPHRFNERIVVADSAKKSPLIRVILRRELYLEIQYFKGGGIVATGTFSVVKKATSASRRSASRSTALELQHEAVYWHRPASVPRTHPP